MSFNYNAQGKLVELFFQEEENIKAITYAKKEVVHPHTLTMVHGNATIDGNSTWEFGQGIKNKHKDAGKIGYNAFSRNGLDIVGAGKNKGDRLVNIFDNLNVKGNLQLKGPINGPSSGLTLNNGLLIQNGGLSVGASAGAGAGAAIQNGTIEADAIKSRENVQADGDIYVGRSVNINGQLCIDSKCVDRKFFERPCPPGPPGPQGQPGTPCPPIPKDLTVNSICLGSTCINEMQLQSLIQKMGMASASSSPSQTNVLNFMHPIDGRPWKIDGVTLRLNSGTPMNLSIYNGSEVYKSGEGRVALRHNNDTNLSIRHSGYVLWAHPFAANNFDFAWKFFPRDGSGNNYLIYNDFNGGHYIGYDAASDRLLIVPQGDGRLIVWKATIPVSL
jgi:hypothetical protein